MSSITTLSDEEKKLILTAAKIDGRTLTSFIRYYSCQKAKEMLKENDQ